jgi:hypothetical protein
MKRQAGWDDIGTAQRSVLARAREYLRARTQQGVDVARTPDCHLNGWAQVPGNARLHQLAGERGASLRVLLARAKDALHYVGQAGYEVVDESAGSTAFTRLVVSWCRAGDFSEDGRFHDRYFGISSAETPETLWFLMAIDQHIPARRDKNIVVFRQIPGRRSTAAFRLVQETARVAVAPASEDGTGPTVSAITALADQVTAAVLALVQGRTFASVLLPYEAQPFQHTIFRALKRQDPRIQTVGYLHSALPPLPADLIHRSGAPELLLVHGRGQADILARHLGWSPASLVTIKSLRYQLADDRPFGGLIFLPYAFRDARVIEETFEDLLRKSIPGSLPRLAVRNHPVMDGSKRHAHLQSRLEELMLAYANRFSPDATPRRPVSIFIGATAAILEALERGITALQICSQPLTESHDAQLWQSLRVERLGKYLFRYELATPGVYVELGPGTRAVAASNEIVRSCLGMSAHSLTQDDAVENAKGPRRAG